MENHFFQTLESLEKGQALATIEILKHLSFNDRGLVPVIAQDHGSGEVLMLAWMNRDSLDETLRTRRMCYWSRSRGELWRKGESSGNRQTLKEMRIDCDGDTILCLVDQVGPACHTDRISCFYLRVDGEKTAITAKPVTKAR
ncbi:MAG: phosphoribosyl-AMP cyclohydrolase [Cellvibrionaceae bacterium]|jgi:phosphoribosyl-AMP cyclohydrolase